MLAVKCPEVRNARGEVLVSERRIVRMVDDGAGRITITVLCYCGQLHDVHTGRATREAAVTPLATRQRTPDETAAPAALAS